MAQWWMSGRLINCDGLLWAKVFARHPSSAADESRLPERKKLGPPTTLCPLYICIFGTYLGRYLHTLYWP